MNKADEQSLGTFSPPRMPFFLPPEEKKTCFLLRRQLSGASLKKSGRAGLGSVQSPRVIYLNEVPRVSAYLAYNQDNKLLFLCSYIFNWHIQSQIVNNSPIQLSVST